MKKRVFVSVLLLAALLTLTAHAAGEPQLQAVLSWTEGSASGSMTVSWTASQNANTYAEFINESALNSGNTQFSRVYGSGKEVRTTVTGFYRYEANMTGLNPNTAYCYRIVRNGETSPWSRFVTAPPRAEMFSFFYLGDIQVNLNMYEELADWSALLQTAYSDNPGAAFGIIGGDLVQSGPDALNWSAFLDAAEPLFSRIPLMPVNGNHESNYQGGKPESYLDIFALPKNGPQGFEEEFYSYDYGSAHIIALNSHMYSGEQKLSQADFDRIADWMRSDLAASNAKWKIAILHHPAYAVASDAVSAEVLQNWVPIFEEAKLDVVFEGHQHVYARSKPLYQGSVDYENGIVYIMGVSGSKFYDSANEGLMDRVIYKKSNYQLVEVDDNSMSVTTYSAVGALLDAVTLRARERGYGFISGDMDGDGVLSAYDLTLLIEALLNRDFYNPASDVNGDGYIDVRDAHELMIRIGGG